MTSQEMKMTDEPMTLREKVIEACCDVAVAEDLNGELCFLGPCASSSLVDAIAAILEDTGAPAHMRVAKELRGEK